jgi:dCMP deaminase
VKLSELTKWDHRFLNLAAYISGWSKDPSTKCGAVITKGNKIISLGYNGFSKGIKDSVGRLNNRDAKYQLVVHAETNAILFSKEDLLGCTIYTWPFPPCCRCAVNIIQADITRVVAPFPSGELEERWKSDLTMAKVIYAESGIQFDEVELDIKSEWVDCPNNHLT